MITAVLTASRVKYLERVVRSLEDQTMSADMLVVMFEGYDYDVAYDIIKQNYTGEVAILKSQNPGPSGDVMSRRQNIVDIHNQIRQLLPSIAPQTDWIFSIEDDGILPDDALAKLIEVTKNHLDAGVITGVELGRRSIRHVGVWGVDDINDPKIVTSLKNKSPEPLVEQVDGCGLYCALVRADLYNNHEFTTVNGLGPDINLGLFARQSGFMNYVDWSVPVTHLTEVGMPPELFEIEIPATDKSIVVSMVRQNGSTWAIQH